MNVQQHWAVCKKRTNKETEACLFARDLINNVCFVQDSSVYDITSPNSETDNNSDYLCEVFNVKPCKCEMLHVMFLKRAVSL